MRRGRARYVRAANGEIDECAKGIVEAAEVAETAEKGARHEGDDRSGKRRIAFLTGTSKTADVAERLRWVRYPFSDEFARFPDNHVPPQIDVCM